MYSTYKLTPDGSILDGEHLQTPLNKAHYVGISEIFITNDSMSQPSG